MHPVTHPPPYHPEGCPAHAMASQGYRRCGSLRFVTWLAFFLFPLLEKIGEAT